MNTEQDIQRVTDEIRDLLQAKNKSYGDTALNPKRIFSQLDAIELLKVRIDDKLSRIATASTEFVEDAELDLIGYLILLRIARQRKAAAAAVSGMEDDGRHPKWEARIPEDLKNNPVMEEGDHRRIPRHLSTSTY